MGIHGFPHKARIPPNANTLSRIPSHRIPIPQGVPHPESNPSPSEPTSDNLIPLPQFAIAPPYPPPPHPVPKFSHHPNLLAKSWFPSQTLECRSSLLIFPPRNRPLRDNIRPENEKTENARTNLWLNWPESVDAPSFPLAGHSQCPCPFEARRQWERTWGRVRTTHGQWGKLGLGTFPCGVMKNVVGSFGNARETTLEKNSPCPNPAEWGEPFLDDQLRWFPFGYISPPPEPESTKGEMVPSACKALLGGKGFFRGFHVPKFDGRVWGQVLSSPVGGCIGLEAKKGSSRREGLGIGMGGVTKTQGGGLPTGCIQENPERMRKAILLFHYKPPIWKNLREGSVPQIWVVGLK
ncbi:hypothetical protein BU15DRAFT_69032 [Melanogaster broomeanus]|nr:hypothetical protein BU15DRAFT_69032 [Melanogaster broomeanus]